MYNPFDEAYHGLCEEILEIGIDAMIAHIQGQFPNLGINCVSI